MMNTQAEFRTPLENGLSFLVDAEDYPFISQRKWAIENGRICPAGETPTWMSSRSLARHLANAGPDTWTLYKNGYRLDLRKSNLEALRPVDWHEHQRNHPAPASEVPEPLHHGTAWSAKFRAWTTPYFVKHPGHPMAHFFNHEADAAKFAQEQRGHFRKVAEEESNKGFYYVPVYRLAPFKEMLPDGKHFQSMRTLLLALRSFALKPGDTSCDANLTALAGMLGCSERTISRGLASLKSAGIIDYKPTRGGKVGRREDGSYFSKWKPHRVSFAANLQTKDEDPGRFPLRLFTDERYLDASFKSQALLIALYALACGQATVEVSLDELVAEALLSEKHTLIALDELQSSGLITGFSKPAPGQRAGYNSRGFRLGLVEIAARQIVV